MADQKTTFPELVGMSQDEAQKAIQTANPALQVEFLEEGSPVTEDQVPNRLRVFVKDGKVTCVPSMG